MIRTSKRLALFVCRCISSKVLCLSDFDIAMIGVRTQEKPINLDGEQLVLADGQVNCGVQNDLWDAPMTVGDRSIARLLDKGRALKFFDDVVVRDGVSQVSYAQVRGQFDVEVTPPEDIKDAGEGVKLVNIRVGARIMHSCFGSPLPIMGVRKGQFAPDALPQLRFVQEGADWKFDKIIH